MNKYFHKHKNTQHSIIYSSKNKQTHGKKSKGDRKVIILSVFTRITFIVTKHRILTWKSAREIMWVTKSKSHKEGHIHVVLC